MKRYCERLGLDPSPSLLDDHSVTLQFACIEWVDAKCNQYADENDLTKVSKAINTGSATGSVKPVGMASRQEWFAKAWGIWGEKGKPDTPPAEPMTTGQAVAKGRDARCGGEHGCGNADPEPARSLASRRLEISSDTGPRDRPMGAIKLEDQRSGRRGLHHHVPRHFGPAEDQGASDMIGALAFSEPCGEGWRPSLPLLRLSSD